MKLYKKIVCWGYCIDPSFAEILSIVVGIVIVGIVKSVCIDDVSCCLSC